MPTTEPDAYGPTRNPWNLEHSTGGSSGGSAAAVASRMVAVAHAGDGGGSIRIPASECGLVGLVPSLGPERRSGPRTGRRGAGLVRRHVVTRTVRDRAAVLDAVHGWMPGDPYSAPSPARPFAAEVEAEPGSPAHRRPGRHGRSDGGGAPDCVAAVHAVAQLLRRSATTSARADHELCADDAANARSCASAFFNAFGAWTAAALDDLGERSGTPVTGLGGRGRHVGAPASWAAACRRRFQEALAVLQPVHPRMASCGPAATTCS